MRVFGKVKSFDRTTGTGCAISDAGAQAAFTSETLKPFGLTQIDEGVALSFELTLERGALVAGKIYEIAGKAPGAAAPGDRAPPPLRVKGHVQWFDANKGYGFVVSKDVYGDVLLHRSVLDAIGVDSVREGAVLDFDYIVKLKGVQVTRIHAVLPPEQQLPPRVEPPAVPTGGSIFVTDLFKRFRMRGPQFMPQPVPRFNGPKGFGFVVRGGDDPWLDAVCKWFSRPKGFGFLRSIEGDEDIFVHMDVLRRSGLRELKGGQRVRVETAQTERGLTAIAIELATDEDGGHA
jgi:CspA family cold shock protein